MTSSRNNRGNPSQHAQVGGEASLFVPNGIIFLLDPGHPNIVVPQYEAGHAAASSPSCTSIATVPEVDGVLNVRLVSSGAGDAGVLLFSGEVETPTGTLTVGTREIERVLALSGLPTRSHVRVYGNVRDSPHRITVVVS
jgi:hypothetical protein